MPPPTKPNSTTHRDTIVQASKATGSWRNMLMDRMARKLGVRLEDHLANGELTPPQLDRMIGRCHACGDRDGCIMYLNTGTSDVRKGFEHCPNRKIMLTLRALARRPKPEARQKRKRNLW